MTALQGGLFILDAYKWPRKYTLIHREVETVWWLLIILRYTVDSGTVSGGGVVPRAGADARDGT